MNTIKKLIKYFFIAYLFQLAIYIHAQEYTFHQYGVEQGLPSSEVYQVFQDSRGYIWFATDMGISRFNGFQFTNFDIKNGLTNNTIFEIFEDHHGKIWFLSLSNKLSYFYNDTIIQYKHNKIIEEHSQNSKVPVKKTLFIDSLNNIYFSVMDRGIFKFSSVGMYTNLQKNDKNGTLRIIEIQDKLVPGYNYKDSSINKIIYEDKTINIKNNKNTFGSSPTYFIEYASNNDEILISYNKNIYKLKSNKLTCLKTFKNNLV